MWHIMQSVTELFLLFEKYVKLLIKKKFDLNLMILW